MKIMILVTDLPSQLTSITGGVQSAVVNLLEGLSKINATVRVLTFGDYTDPEKTLKYSPTIDIVYCFAGKMPVNSLNYFFNSPPTIKKHIRQFEPDIIHYETGDAFLFTKFRGLLGTKNLLTLHGHAFAEAKHKKKFSQKLNLYINGFIEKILIPRNLIFISDYSRKEMNIKNSEKHPRIYNAISSGYFDLALKKTFDARLLFVGVLSRRKNLMALLQSLNRLKKQNQIFKLDIVGDFDDDKYKEEVFAYIQENDLQPLLCFHGWKTQKEVKSFLEMSDILVLPSLQETLPMAIAEAMAAGKTVIATSIGGIPEMIESGYNGYLYNANNIDELTSILQRIYTDPEICLQVGKRAKETAVNKFYCESIAKQTLGFYNDILNTGNKQKVLN